MSTQRATVKLVDEAPFNGRVIAGTLNRHRIGRTRQRAILSFRVGGDLYAADQIAEVLSEDGPELDYRTGRTIRPAKQKED